MVALRDRFRPGPPGLFPSSAGLVAALLGCMVAVVRGQTTVTGTVREDSTMRPLSGIDVLLEGSGRLGITDDLGQYRVELSREGWFVILFRGVGYKPYRTRLRVPQGMSLVVDAALIPQAVYHLDSVVVKGTTPGPRGIGVEAFEERRRLGFGRFFDEKELRRSEHLRFSDLMRRIPGVKLFPPGRHPYAYNTRMLNCPFGVVLDGVMLNSPPDLNFFDVASLAAVEVYRGAAEVPVEYGGSRAECGLIMRWTRRGP